MRKCPRCDVEMMEGFCLRSYRDPGPVSLHKMGKLFGSEVDYLRAAVCPECGELSIYLPNAKLLEQWKEPGK